MSETTTGSSVTTVAPLIEQEIGFWKKSDLYDPNNPPTSASSTNRIVPALESIVIDGNVLYTVAAVSSDYETTLQPIELSDETGGYGLASVISYGNDVFRAYYDTRTLPYRLTVDRRCLIYGGAPSFYTLTRYPNTTNAIVISQYFSTTGVYTSSNIPMLEISSGSGMWWCQPCQIPQTLTDNEELLLTVYNETGATIATVTVFAKQSDIVNDTLLYQPRIVDLQVRASQMDTAGNCYLFEKQDPGDLEITGLLVYDNGSTRPILVDDAQTWLFGIEDLIASYAGLTQSAMIKYFLASNETGVQSSSTESAVTITSTAISREFTVKVYPNKIGTPVKVTVIPEWDANTSTYTLQYFLYTTARSAAVRVTPNVTITGGSYDGGNFTTVQSFSFSLDLNQVDPSTYTMPTIYAQNCVIKLQPVSALVKFTLQDALSSQYVYGQDNSSTRRPMIVYDTTLTQYFIPSSVFMTEEAVLQSFYFNASPPYDPTSENAPPTPTHFLIRDAFTGAMLTSAVLPLSNYTQAFNLLGGSTGDFIGVTVIFEFIQQVSGVNNILYGVPVDVTTGTYIGL